MHRSLLGCEYINTKADCAGGAGLLTKTMSGGHEEHGREYSVLSRQKATPVRFGACHSGEPRFTLQPHSPFLSSYR